MKTSNSNLLAGQIKEQLDGGLSALDDDAKRKLKAARYEALEHASSPWTRLGLPALGTALASVLLVVIVIAQWPDTDITVDMAALQSGDIEMLSTLELEEIEELDFYLWLEEQNGAV